MTGRETETRVTERIHEKMTGRERETDVRKEIQGQTKER
jgi:hypothetical protein